MAEPGGADPAGGVLAAASPPPPPPPPPPQPLPPQTETTGTDMAERRGAGAPSEEQTAGLPPPGQPPVHTEAPGAGAQPPRAPSKESATAAEAENQPAAPLPTQQKKQQNSTAKDGEDSATTEPRPARWRRVRPAVLWLLSLFRLRSQSKPIEQPKIPPPPPGEGTGGGRVPDKAGTEKDEGEGSKRRRHEAEAPPASASGEKESPPMKPHETKRRKSMQRTESIPPPQGEVAGGALDAGCPPMKKKLQNAGTLVMKTMSWYRRHRSPEEEDKPVHEPAAQKEKVEEITKPSPSPAPQEKEEVDEEKSQENKAKAHRRWEKVEARLETILEKACTRMVSDEYTKLNNVTKQLCLLTFSVFPLGREVKKQAVTYWWATQFFGLSPAKCVDADDVFTELSDRGFLEPIKNRCSKVIHGCRVNPLVHWMVKHQAKQDEFADLEVRGNPADEQPKSAVLCLTAGNRGRLQNLCERDEWQSEARAKPAGTKKTSKEPSHVKEVAGPSQDIQSKSSIEDQIVTQLDEFDKKKVIVNINAHVYRLPELVLSKLADRLEVLQLGRWWNSDDNTYMEVEALKYIGKLKNLRYLSLRGLSQLVELPTEFRKLSRLAILDLRGCQNLVKVSSSGISNLKGLTHLDLTECYMLEHIGRGVIALSELQVFKGFVFGVGVQRRNACRLSDLMKLKKLRKLSINITTDTKVRKGEMAQLGKLASLHSLTVTWGELPSILCGVEEKNKRLTDFFNEWTGLVLPPQLKKLDVRCYPRDTLPEKWFRGLTKLYVRGGDVKKLDIPRENHIEMLRLRYLNKFEMPWNKLFAMLNKDIIKFVEVVDSDQKVMMDQTKGKGEMVKDEQRKKRKINEKERISIKKRMNVPESTLDEKGVWIRDEKEKYDDGQALGMVSDKVGEGDGDAGKAQTKVKEGEGGSLEGTKAEDGPPKEEDGGDTTEVKKIDSEDQKGREMVKEQQDNKNTAKEDESNLNKNGVPARDGKKIKEGEKKRASSTPPIDQSTAPVNSGYVKEGAGTYGSGIDKSDGSVKAPQQAPHVASKEDAPKTEAASGATESPKVSGNGGKGDDDGHINGAAEAEDEPATEEDIGDGGEVKNDNGGEVKNADGGGDSDKAQTAEGEGEDKDEGQVRRREVRRDTVDVQSTIREDGDDDTSAPDATSSPAARRPELKEETVPTKLIPAAKGTTSRTETLPAPPASTGPAPAVAGEAAAEPKEHGKAGDDDGLAAGATESTDTTTGRYAFA